MCLKVFVTSIDIEFNLKSHGIVEITYVMILNYLAIVVAVVVGIVCACTKICVYPQDPL